MKSMTWVAVISALLVTQSATAAITYNINWTEGVQDEIDITIGDSVRWVWGGGFHTVKYFSGPTSFDESDSSSLLGFTVTESFMTVGEWQIICGIHGQSMSTFITVSEAVSEVPVPAAAWLFGSALVGLASVKRKRCLRA